MKLLITMLAATQFVANIAQAETTILFDAEEQCRSIETTEGIRYIPPCALPDTEFTFSFSDANDISTQTPALAVTFQCESIRPLRFSYQLSEENHVIMNGELAGSKDIEQAKSTFSVDKLSTDYTFKLTEINGAVGFQAIKPNCKFIVETADNVSVETVENMDVITLTELTKLNIAIWDTTTRALAEKNTRFFKYELNNSKFWLATIDDILVTKSHVIQETLNSAIEQINTAWEACGSRYCYYTPAKEIETLQSSSEQAVTNIQEVLNNKLEAYDFGNEELTTEITAWLQLRTLIIEKLAPLENDDN